MKRFGLILCGLMVTGGASMGLLSCSKQLVCGQGTVEQNDECVSAAPIASNCSPDAGDLIIDGICVPANVGPVLCGNNTVYSPMTHRCEGSGGGVSGCAATCSA